MMRVWRTVAEWQNRQREFTGRTVGFVPTMGALHRGHASLMERCRAENDVTVASIFVNPTQFNDPGDLTRYPRTLDDDLALLESVGTDDVLLPSAAEMYRNAGGASVIPGPDALVMEAAFRPGFLEGVLTIVLKLLNLVRPCRAYFGEKDYQQLRAVTELSRSFFCATEIVPCATVREASGLAMSSRNMLLTPEARLAASRLFHTLTNAPTPGEAERTLAAHGFHVEYVEEHWGRRLAAAHFHGVRLIDNVTLPRVIPAQPH